MTDQTNATTQTDGANAQLPENDPETQYLIMAEMGTEGPYTVSKLRDLLVQGRIRSTDRVMDAQTRSIMPVAEVIEGAGKISELRPALKEHARQQSQRRKAEMLAKPAAVLDTPAEAPAPPPDSAVAEFQRREVKKHHSAVRGVLVVIVALAVLSGGWWMIDGLHLGSGSGSAGGSSALNEPKSLTAFATWRVVKTAIPEFKDATITLSQEKMIIASGGTSEEIPLGGISVFAPGAFMVVLKSPHATLGAQLTVVVETGKLRLMARRGEINCEPAG